MQKLDIKMTGNEMEPQKMTVTMSHHARNLVLAHHASEDPDTVLMHVSLLLERKDIADYVLNEVRIGDCAVILDEDNGCAYGVRMFASEVIIQTVFRKKQSTNWMNMGRDEFLTLLKNAEIKVASIFSDESTMVAVL